MPSAKELIPRLTDIPLTEADAQLVKDALKDHAITRATAALGSAVRSAVNPVLRRLGLGELRVWDATEDGAEAAVAAFKKLKIDLANDGSLNGLEVLVSGSTEGRQGNISTAS